MRLSLLRAFLPILGFVVIFVGCGFVLSLQGDPHAFYRMPSPVAALVAVMIAWMLHRGDTQNKVNDLIAGAAHRDIMTMCLIFLMAGAFSTVTQQIGSVQATVYWSLNAIPASFLLPGIFLCCALISTAIGTAMGTIAAVGPIAAHLALASGMPAALTMGACVSGAMFGDNLSLISDTTIAAVSGQQAQLRGKMLLNFRWAIVPSLLTLALYFFLQHSVELVEQPMRDPMLIVPYGVLIMLALSGMNVFSVLTLSLLCAGILGFLYGDYTLWDWAQGIVAGFESMHEIMVLSLLIGGISGLSHHDFARVLSSLQEKAYVLSQRQARFSIAAIAMLFDALLANNTIAIVLAGPWVKNLGQAAGLSAEERAAYVDTFACVAQGLIPYGAQILLASQLAGLSPLEIVPYVFYCMAIGLWTLFVSYFTNKSGDKAQK